MEGPRRCRPAYRWSPGLGHTQEALDIVVAEVVLGLLDRLPTGILDGRRDGLDVIRLVLADPHQILANLGIEPGLLEGGFIEFLEPVPVEGVLQVLQGEGVVEDLEVVCEIRGRGVGRGTLLRHAAAPWMVNGVRRRWSYGVAA